MPKKIERLNFNQIKTYPLRERENKVKISDFSKNLPSKGVSVRSFLDGLPNILAVRDFKAIVKAIVDAKNKGKPVIFCLGAHVIKCGLNPVMISLMESGIISGIALNGAGSIHDFEIALIGGTSEDVSASIEDGTFGMAEETGTMMNDAFSEGVKQGIGAGQSLGEKILKNDFKYSEYSILAKGIEYEIPVTVHIAVGTDIIHQHPACDGAALGEASYIDFQIFTGQVSKLGDGGVVVNIGSNVILPEVFLKAITIARNLGYQVKNFTTANFDMIQHYRPVTNVVKRPVSTGGKGYLITGHHEIMIPMLAQAIIEESD
jgi:hypothetical protein